MKVTDLTPTFRELAESKRKEPGADPDKSRILRVRGRKAGRDPFEKRARDIAGSVTQLKDFLLENRKAYLDLVHQSPESLGDGQRDKIDAGANVFIRTCNGLISQFKKDLHSATKELGETRVRHLEAVCDLLEAYLKAACEIYAGQRAIRVQREFEFQKLSRLEVKARRQSENDESLEDRQRLLLQRLYVDNDDELMDTDDQSSVKEEMMQSSESTQTTTTEARNTVPAKQKYVEEENEELEELSPEEVQLLEAENEKLYEDFLSVQDSVKQIENKVVKIAELQEVFTEKILQQKDDIDHIALNAVASTENVKDGNEELRKAIQNQASVRVYILFFLLVMSFSLLFLDWYND